MHGTLTEQAPALSVLRDAFERGTLAHIAVDWQYRYRPKDHLLLPLEAEDHAVRAAYDRAALFTQKIYPEITTLSVGYKGSSGNDLYLRDADEYGMVFWKQTSSAFKASGFSRFMDATSYDTLIISGLYARDCQGETVFDALERGYKVLVPTDMVVRELVRLGRNLSQENEPASDEVDADVRDFYFRYDNDTPAEAALAGNLHGLKSYEILRTLAL